jgi:hypothetical protein
MSREDALAYQKEAEAQAASRTVIREEAPVPVCVSGQELIKVGSNHRDWYCQVTCQSPAYRVGEGVNSYCEVLNCPAGTEKVGEGTTAWCKDTSGNAQSGAKSVTGRSSAPILRQRVGVAGMTEHHMAVGAELQMRIVADGENNPAVMNLQPKYRVRMNAGWYHTPHNTNWSGGMDAHVSTGVSYDNNLPTVGARGMVGYQVIPVLGVQGYAGFDVRLPAVGVLKNGAKVDLPTAGGVFVGLNLHVDVSKFSIASGLEWYIPVKEDAQYGSSQGGALRLNMVKLSYLFW